MGLPAPHGIQAGCFTEDHLRLMCAYEFFRQLMKLVNFLSPNCSIAIGKIPCLSWLIRMGLYMENF